MKNFFLIMFAVLICSVSKAQEIGTCSMSDGWLKVEGVNGNTIYSGSASGDLMAYSSKIIVTQRSGDTYVYTVIGGNLKMLFGGNLPKGTVVNASGTSFFTKSGSDNCKYTIRDGECYWEYCRNY